MKIHSFFRTESFVFVLRGRRLILGEITDLLEGDLRVCGSKRHGCLRVSVMEHGRFRPMGGGSSRTRLPMPAEMCERVFDAVRTLGADEFFIVLCAMLLVESGPGVIAARAQPVAGSPSGRPPARRARAPGRSRRPDRLSRGDRSEAADAGSSSARQARLSSPGQAPDRALLPQGVAA